MGRGKARFPMGSGKAVSVYLKYDVLLLLEREISKRSKPVKGSIDRVTPKGLTIPRLVAACVDYVINENKLECLSLPFKRYPERS